VIRRYGSEAAALAPCEREMLLREAVRQWSKMIDPPSERWTKSIDGWSGLTALGELSARAREALSTAYALPATIEEAIAEDKYWQQRAGELGLIIHGRRDDSSNLDMCAQARQSIVLELLETGIRAQSIKDVLARQRYMVESETLDGKINDAVLADLAHLHEMATEADRGIQDSVQNGQAQSGDRRTASDRRDEVTRLLCNVDTAKLPDREIARRVGVSPQTVGNIRRRLKPFERYDVGFVASPAISRASMGEINAAG
jgi:hypothetical protein